MDEEAVVNRKAPVALIGLDLPSVFDRDLQDSLLVNEWYPCLKREGPRPMGQVREVLVALAQWEIDWEPEVKALEIFKAWQEPTWRHRAETYRDSHMCNCGCPACEWPKSTEMLGLRREGLNL